MRFRISLLLLMVSALACAEDYGAPITLKDPLSLEAAVKRLGAQMSAEVLLESKVDKVCEQAGCWIGLKDASGKMHVTFKDEAFVVPMSLIGKTVQAQGRLTRIPMTLDETRRYVQHEGGDPAAVREPAVRYEFVASGLHVKT